MTDLNLAEFLGYGEKKAPRLNGRQRARNRYRKELDRLGGNLEFSKSGIESLQKDVKNLKESMTQKFHLSPEVFDPPENKSNPKKKPRPWRSEQVRGLDLDNGRRTTKESELKDALALINPSRLVSVYSYERKFINPEDEDRWRVVFRDDYYQMPALRPRPHFETRDRDGLLIITNLESMKPYIDPDWDLHQRMVERRSVSEDDTLLFNRNWAITEPRTGPSFKEFINYDKL